MRLWTAVLVAGAVAVDLEAKLPDIRWDLRKGLLAVVALTALTLPLLQRFLRAAHEQHTLLLPVTGGERAAIDFAAVMLFLLPPHLLIVASSRSYAIAALLVAGAVLETLLLGKARVTERPQSRSAFTITRAYELRWLIRIAGGRMVLANILALLTLGGAELAIVNNEVVRLHSIMRIAGAFTALGAAVVAADVIAARTQARPWRAAEAALPISADARVGAALTSALLAATPFLAAIAFVRPIALAFVLPLMCMLVLAGEARSLRNHTASTGAIFGIAAAASVTVALDARVAIVVALVTIPWLWRAARDAYGESDVPTVVELAA